MEIYREKRNREINIERERKEKKESDKEEDSEIGRQTDSDDRNIETRKAVTQTEKRGGLTVRQTGRQTGRQRPKQQQTKKQRINRDIAVINRERSRDIRRLYNERQRKCRLFVHVSKVRKTTAVTATKMA